MYPPTQSCRRVQILYLEALTQSPLCYAGRKTVRELLTHHDNDPLHNAMICQQVTLSGDAEWPKVAGAVIKAFSLFSYFPWSVFGPILALAARLPPRCAPREPC